jgi:hypothetical protein
MAPVDALYAQRADLLLRRLHRGDMSVCVELGSIARQEGASELKRAVNEYRLAVWAHGRNESRARVTASAV